MAGNGTDNDVRNRVENAQKAFFIRLGRGNENAVACLKADFMMIGYREVSHETVSRIYGGESRSEVHRLIREEASGTRKGIPPGQILDFYVGGSNEKDPVGKNTIWINYCNMRLWWTLANKPVQAGKECRSVKAREIRDQENRANEQYRVDENSPGPRRGTRWDWRWRDITGWRDVSLAGEPLYLHRFGWLLNVSQSFTVREIKGDSFCYLQKLILGEDTLECAPSDKKAERAKMLIRRLDSGQFEWFVNKLFCDHLGWERVSAVGSTIKDIDMAVRNKETGTLAFIQVKAASNIDKWKHLVDRADEFFKMGKAREKQKVEFYLVYHSLDAYGDYSLNWLEGVKNARQKDKEAREKAGKSVVRATRRYEKAACQHGNALKIDETIKKIEGNSNIRIHPWGPERLVKEVVKRDDLYEWLKERVGLSRWET